MNEVVSKEKKKKKFYRTWYGIALIILCFIVIISSFSSSGTVSEQKAQVGSPVSLSAKASDCSGDVIVGRNKQIEDRLTQLSIAGDNLGIAEMVFQGQAFFVSSCTHAIVIDIDFSNAIDEVRIMGGDHVGESGWIPYEWARKIN